MMNEENYKLASDLCVGQPRLSNLTERIKSRLAAAKSEADALSAVLEQLQKQPELQSLLDKLAVLNIR